jgi:hypothetical protein
MNDTDQLEKGSKDAVSCLFEQSLVISSGSTLGHADALPNHIYTHGLIDKNHLFIGLGSAMFKQGDKRSTTAEGGAGAADAATVTYSEIALTNAGNIRLARIDSTQTTAGTWATNPTIIKSPFSLIPPTIRYLSNAGPVMTRLAWTTLLYEDLSIDPYNSYNISTGVFTAPWAGNYTFYAQAQADAVSGGTKAMMRVLLSDGSLMNHGASSLSPDPYLATRSLTAISGVTTMTAGATITVAVAWLGF